MAPRFAFGAAADEPFLQGVFGVSMPLRASARFGAREAGWGGITQLLQWRVPRGGSFAYTCAMTSRNDNPSSSVPPEQAAAADGAGEAAGSGSSSAPGTGVPGAAGNPAAPGAAPAPGTPAPPGRPLATAEIFEPEVRRHHRRKRKLVEFTHSSTRATMLMLAAALAAFVIENTPALPYFAEFWHTFEISLSLGDFSAHLTLEHFINDFLMALFFLLVGLEIKYEMTAGELTNPRKALLPIVAAAGGAIVPALVYTVVNIGSGFEQGWGVPMANDIAFCLGILALLGSRVPLGLRVFLYGSTKEHNEQARRALQQRFPSLQIVGGCDGYQDADVIEQINGSSANIVFVAKGTPAQERWIAAHKQEVRANVFLGVGGALDIWSGALRRAPQWIQRLGLEWLFRMVLEPRRFVQLPQLIRFQRLVWKEKRKRQVREHGITEERN